MSTTVTYLFDPLCGWCYAAAPALQYLQGVDAVQVSLAPTGLFAGAGARPMDAPERELDALHALQQARYVDGCDTADTEVIAQVLHALGLAAAAALTLAPDAALRSLVAERVAQAQATLRAVGARGVPQLVVAGQGGALRLISSDALLGPRESLLAQVLAG
jgi:putative protein-disulfide isomerase